MASTSDKKTKSNEWLSVGDSDNDSDAGGGYNSEEEDLRASRAAATTASSRPSKRRRIEQGNDDEASDDDDSAASGNEQEEDEGDEEAEDDEAEDSDEGFDRLVEAAKSKYGKKNITTTTASASSSTTLLPSDGIITSASHMKPLSKSELLASKKSIKKTGVVYLSRIPPFMKPQKVKHLLSRFGPINRIFLSPEDPKSYKRRIKFGGNKKRMFDEGWVEFLSKKHAKLCAETLNAQQIGGKKGGFYYDDVWNIKYLRKFKWYHLTEQIANENASRQARLRAEIAMENRENKRYIQNVERAKMIENMQASKKRKAEEAESGGGAGGAATTTGKKSNDSGDGGKIEVKRQFRQNTAIIEGKGAKGKSNSGGGSGSGNKDQNKALQTLLGKIF